MIKNKKLIILGIGILFVASIVIFGKSDRSNVNDPKLLETRIEHIKGNKESNILLVEYSDFQCPACGTYYPLVEQIVEEFGDDIKFEYRHFPLRQIHRNAEPAALAAEAAGLQGKFWEMYSILFERQSEWSNKTGDSIFTGYAEEIGIDSLKFENDMSLNKDIKNKVEGDYKSGLKLRVNGTPTFFLNGEKMKSPKSYEEFRDMIQQIIIAQ